MEEIGVSHWTAKWECPHCGNHCDDLEEGVDDEGDVFDVTCEWCGGGYLVRK